MTDEGRDGLSRRAVLAGLAATGAGGLAGCGGGTGSPTATTTRTGEFANLPVDGDRVTIGATLPRSGVYSGEGERLLAGIELAVEHVNEGGGLVGTDAVSLSGDGLAGRTVELRTADTTSDPETAGETARELVDEGAVALTGGASGGEARSLAGVADERGLVYMAGFVPSDVINGADCSRFAFNETMNPSQVARALAFSVAQEFGAERTFAQVYPRSTSGQQLFRAMKDALSQQAAWTQVRNTPTREGVGRIRGAIEDALAPDPDVLVLDYYGLDGANAVATAREVAGDDVGIVVPVFDRVLAANASGAIGDIVGAVHWHPAIDNEATAAFAEGWRAAYADDDRVPTRPTDLGHLGYVQVLGYAAAVERAGTFEPPAVVDALEAHRYDVGLGTETMRACNHHANRPVPVVRGLPPAEQTDGRFFELQTTATGINYACDDPPASDCPLEVEVG
jgi:ABC-type branched-subunit amino acid transport system substrate-binding protein